MTLAICPGAMFCGGSQTAHATPLHEGLVGYWALNGNALDGAPGGVVADHGEVRNGPTWLADKFGGGVQFDGTSQGIVIPASSDLDIATSGVTVSAWVKLDVLPNAIPTNWTGIYDATPDNYVLYLDKANNELRFKATTANGTTSGAHPGVPASMLDTTGWHHVMGTYDGSLGASKIYFNGNLVDVSSVHTVNGVVRSGQIAGIGAQPKLEAGNPLETFFAGAVADVAVWNRALGATEAQYLFNGGAGNAVGAANPNLVSAVTPIQPAAQPVIRWAFDGNLNNSGTGGPAYDAVLHDQPGRNDALFTPTAMGQGLDLRGNPDTPSTTTNGDYLSVDYELTDSGTIELRFTPDKFYDFQTLWSNSVHGNAWESWVTAAGNVATRANNATAGNALDFHLPITGGLGATHHIAFTWTRDGSTMESRLYVNGVLRERTTETWREAGTTVFLGGGLGVTGGANDLGSGVYDEFRIYDVALSESEVLFRAQVPEPTSAAIAGLGAMLLAGCCGRRVRR
jgi:hypothetical protein